ncbi:MAG: hypothetical protein H0X39_08820 [Actinobacteria bacterium]|nr:hypothetical protein [Actinomycetota bacterium]
MRARAFVVVATGFAVIGWGVAVSAAAPVSTQFLHGTRPEHPRLVVRPHVVGVARVGGTLAARPGQWAGRRPISFSYRWQRCSASGTRCAAIRGATAARHRLVGADLGRRIRIQVTAANRVGKSTAASPATARIAQRAVAPVQPPVSISAPTVTGIAAIGQTLRADVGAWAGTAPLVYTYQWRRCSATCGDIAGATDPTYAPADADVGAALRVVVIATNRAGTANAASNPTSAVPARPGVPPPPSSPPPRSTPPTPPANSSAPTTTGGTQVGQTLTADPGTWSGSTPITYTYNWRRCSAAYPSVVLANAPQSYWRLGETTGTTAVSATGSGGGGYVGGPTLGHSGAFSGDADPAVGLDGVDDAVSMPNPNFSGPFSIELWAFLAGNGSTGATGYATLAGFDSTHRLLWQIAGASSRLLTQFDGNFFSTQTASLNAWHHIVYTFDGAAEHFYIDGSPAGSHPTTLPSWHSAFFLGAYDQANYMFRGAIDDAAVYASALSPAQVVAHYEAGLATGCRLIVGATGPSHVLVPADRGATLQAIVTASNAAGASSASASATSAIAGATPPSNPVTTENALPGTTAWQQPSVDGPTIEGYTSQLSSAPGDSVAFHVSTSPAANYRIELYRMGWYGGAGARLVGCLPGCTTDEPGSARAVPTPDPTTGLLAAGWPVTDTITVPSSWTSGYYNARLVLTSGPQAGSANSVFFIVRAAPTRKAKILVEAPVNTWEAYNNWGGKSLYADGSAGAPAVKVSFNRPGYGQSPMIWEFQAVRFLEREGYDVSYATNYDLGANPSELLDHKLVISLGHDEYWTKGMRDAVTAARDAGVNLAFLGGNDMYWQARYEDGGRTLVVYRNATTDPEPDPVLKSIRWRDLATPNPECRLVGVEGFGGIRTTGDPARDYGVDSSALTDPWLANAEFGAGAALTDLVGYEWDAIAPGCAAPPLTRFFHYEGAPSNADVTRYTAPSGARVLAVGSVQFAWALDGFDGHDAPPDPRAQQFVRNALASLTQ